MEHTYKAIKKLRRLNHIKRCALFPVLKPTSVAEHSWHVSILATCVFFEMEQKGYDVNLGTILAASIFHDTEECFVTDIPYPVKRRIKPALKMAIDEIIGQDIPDAPDWLYKLIKNQTNLNAVELNIVKTCDMAELVMYAREELHMGNKRIWPLLDRALTELANLNATLGSELIDKIIAETNHYNYEDDAL